MVLIFNPATTFTTYKLLDLLISKNISFKLIDPTNIHSLSIKQNDGIPTDIIINGELINLQLVSCVFSTSSNLNLCIDLEDKDFTEFEKGAFVIFLNTEWRKLNEFIAYILQQLPHLSIPYDNENKLKTNEIAKKLGFKIPDSIISTNINNIESYFLEKSEKSFVAKRISEFLSGEFTFIN